MTTEAPTAGTLSHASSFIETELELNEEASKYVQIRKKRLRELFKEIDHEFDKILEENYELRKRLAQYEKMAPAQAISVHSSPVHPSILAQNSKNDKRFSIGHNFAKSLGVKSKPQVGLVAQAGKVGGRVKEFSAKLLIPQLREKVKANQINRRFLYHTDIVWDVQSVPLYSPDVNLIAASSADKTASIWSHNLLNPVLIYTGHKGSVNTIRFHPLKPLAITASGDMTSHIWKFNEILALPQPQQAEQPESSNSEDIQNAAIGIPMESQDTDNDHEDSNHDSGAEDNTEEDVEGAESEDSLPAQAPQPSSGIKQKKLKIPHVEASTQKVHDANTQESLPRNVPIMINTPIVQLTGNYAPVISAEWVYGNGQFDQVATASWDGDIKVYAIEGNMQTPVATFAQGRDSTPNDIQCAHQSSLILSSSQDAIIRIWDVKSTTRNPVNVLKGHSDPVTCAQFSAGDKFIVSGSEDGVFKVWDVRNLKSALRTGNTHSGINRISISNYHSRICFGLNKRQAKIYDISGDNLYTLQYYGHQSMITGCCWSNNGNSVYTCSIDKQIIQWNYEDINAAIA